MNLRLSALLTLKSDGTQKIASDTKKIADNLDKAQKSGQKLSATGAGGLARSGGIPKGDGDGLSRRDHAVARGVAGSRGASGRDFAGLAQLGGETNGIVAAYATLAANVFALTAAFKALSDAAKFVQLAKGLETVGAQSGRTLSIVAKNMEKLSGYAISTVEAMKSVASATAAGFSGKEIERLTRVAKGASVALGRDMSDSIDRLTRGTIKLEPELLDELGIMTRIDEAVRGYALQNKLAASSLTQTQRRQAFLNAVLAEGEMKFGDIADAVDPSAYDKLGASIKKFGTEILTVVNGVLKPFIDALIAMPALGLIPLAGVLSSAFGKLIPDMDKNISAHAKKVELMGTAYEKAKGTLKEFNMSRFNIGENYTAGNNKAIAIALGRDYKPNEAGRLAGSEEYVDRQKVYNSLKSYERDLTRQVAELGKAATAEKLRELAAARATLEIAQAENVEHVKAIAFTKTIADAKIKSNMAQRQSAIQERLGSDLYSDRSSFGALKSYGKAFKSGFGEIGNTYRDTIDTLEGMGDRVDNNTKKIGLMQRASIGVGSVFKALPGLLNTAGQALQSFMGAIFIFIAAVQVLAMAWSWVDENILGNTKRIKELREELSAVQATAAKTAVEIGKLQNVGRFGQSIDAALGSMNELYTKTKELREEQEKIAKTAGRGGNPRSLGSGGGSVANRVIFSGEGVANGRRLGTATTFEKSIGNLSEESRKSVIATGDILGALGDKAQETFVDKIQELKNNPEAMNNYLNNTLEIAANVGASFKDMAAAAKSAGETLAKIRTPDMFVTNYTPVVASIKEMATTYKLLGEASAKLGGDQNNITAGLGESVFKGGASLINELGRLNGNSDEIYDSFIKVTMAQYNLTEAIKKFSTESPQAKKAGDELKQSMVELGEKSGIASAASSSFWEDTQVVIKQTELATAKLKANLAEAQASFMKTTASIVKLRAESDLLAAAGTTKYKDTATEEVTAAQSSYDIARKTAGIKMQVIQAEYGLLAAQIELQKITMRDAQKAKDKNMFIMAEQILNSGNYSLDNIVSEELKGMVEMLRAVEMISEQLGLHESITKQMIANIGQEVAGEKQSLTTAIDKLKAYSNFNQLLMRGLELGKKQLDGRKELLSVTKQISDLQVAGFKSNIERNAFNQQRSVTAEEQRSIEELTLTKALENLKLEQNLVMEEHRFKMQILNLEWTIQKLSLEEQLEKAKIARDGTKPGTSDRASGDAKVGYLSKVLGDATRSYQSAQSSGLSMAFALYEKNTLEAKAATEALTSLPTVVEKFLYDYWKPRNDASKAYGASGGSGNWLALFNANASGASREMGKNAPEGMDPKVIEAMAVSQELFNLELGFTDQILGTVASSFSTMFEGFIDGTAKGKDAFKQFALSILKMIAEIATQMLVLQTLKMFLGPAPASMPTVAGEVAKLPGITLPPAYANGGIIPMATGGIMDRAKGFSGVVNKPTYLTGEGKHNEAVVPLPNGRSIPVQLHSGAGNKNSVQVNVHLNADGSANTTKSGDDMGNLGNAIAQAVQKELQAQKAPGGMLNKYGVA